MKKAKFILYVVLGFALIILISSLIGCTRPMVGGQSTPNCKPYKGYKAKVVKESATFKAHSNL
jgi:hypothetical protein